MSAPLFSEGEIPRRVLVVGFASTGQATAAALIRLGIDVLAVDDAPSDSALTVARSLGVELAAAPERASLAAAIRQSDLIVLSPGVPPSHPVFDLAPDGRVVSEIELGYLMARMPIVAITGTNGKTTVVELVAAMLEASGVRAVAAGNIGVPLVSVVERDDLDVAVVEVSSFQLALTDRFRPKVATWLNFADNHYDWHSTRADYQAAKTRIWKNQTGDDVAIANHDDEVVAAATAAVKSRLVWFGRGADGYHLDGDRLLAPDDTELATTADLPRALPHDRLNALAALATAIESGASVAGCRQALRATPPPAHRISYVGALDGVLFYDDSKATTPAAVVAALGGFASVVLILGGRNKGLDLGVVRVGAERDDTAVVRAVVAIGEAADEVRSAFSGFDVHDADSMDQAVRAAVAAARRGDIVLLSPGCASFDWYDSYGERGDDFVRAVGELAGSQISGRSAR